MTNLSSQVSSTHRRHEMICVLIVLAVEACEPSAPTPAKAPAKESTEQRPEAPTIDPPVAPSAATVSSDTLSRFIAYQEDLAPVLRRVAKAAREPGALKVQSAFLESLERDGTKRELDIVNRRAVVRFKLTKDELTSASSFFKDPRSTTMSGENGTDISPRRSELLRKYEGRLAELQTEIGGVERPIDCGRQPDSCSCTECPYSCNECEGYRSCMNKCVWEMGNCFGECTSFPVACLACPVFYTLCSVNCGEPGCC